MSGEGGASKPAPTDLALLVNFAVSDAIRLAPASTEYAVKVLMLAADLMRKRQPLPYELADYLAGAFEAAMAKKQDTEKVKSLALELNLSALNARPSAHDWVAMYQMMLANPGIDDAALVKLFISETGCSDSHARRKLGQAKKALGQSARADREEYGNKE